MPGAYYASPYYGSGYFSPGYYGAGTSSLVSTWSGTGVAMRRPSPRMFSAQVTMSRVTRWNKDAASGRVPVYAAPSAPILCAVEPSSATDVPEHMREQQVVYHTVKFWDFPGVQIRDVINYAGRQLVVSGVRDTSGGRGRTWVVMAEERPPGVPNGPGS